MTVDDRQQRLLVQFLAESDVPCPACGYNLRQLTASRCPECGEELLLQLALAEPRLAANLTGLIGLAAGAGLNGLLIVYALLRTLFMHDSILNDVQFWVIVGGGFLVEGLALVLWLLFWKKLRHVPLRLKWLTVAGCWGLTIVDIVLFSIFIK